MKGLNTAYFHLNKLKYTSMLASQHRFFINRHGQVRRLHFVGIAGVGMSGIAEVMHRLGYAVSGSDLKEGEMTQRLREMGIQIFIGHHADHAQDRDVLVVSSAVPESNPELVSARAQNIPVVRRAEMLGELMRFRQGIAIAGTHGKTTTTSLCAALLAEGGLDPTYVIGGRLNNADNHAALGTGEYLVAEADESDASFLHLFPVITVVTNIDADHMGTYGGDFQRLRDTFMNFLKQLPFYGLAILCIDEPEIRRLLPHLARPFLSYGLDQTADIYAYDIQQNGVHSHFKVGRKDKADWLDIEFSLPGKHNVNNALAAIAIAYELGVPDRAIKRGLQQFAGIKRRFQLIGDLQVDNGQALLIDDYGHHPREVQATIDAIHTGWPERRLIVIFQPHRYTRTRDLFAEFVAVLAKLDHLILLEVYPAGEPPIVGADGTSLHRAICAQKTQHQPQAACLSHFVARGESVLPILSESLRADDIVLTLGAGDVSRLSSELPLHFANHDPD